MKISRTQIKQIIKEAKEALDPIDNETLTRKTEAYSGHDYGAVDVVNPIIASWDAHGMVLWVADFSGAASSDADDPVQDAAILDRYDGDEDSSLDPRDETAVNAAITAFVRRAASEYGSTHVIDAEQMDAPAVADVDTYLGLYEARVSKGKVIKEMGNPRGSNRPESDEFYDAVYQDAIDDPNVTMESIAQMYNWNVTDDPQYEKLFYDAVDAAMQSLEGGGDTDDEHALTSAGMGTDEDYGYYGEAAEKPSKEASPTPSTSYDLGDTWHATNEALSDLERAQQASNACSAALQAARQKFEKASRYFSAVNDQAASNDLLTFVEDIDDLDDKKEELEHELGGMIDEVEEVVARMGQELGNLE